MMNLLIEKFPEFLIVNGVECPVNWDFRTVLKCNEIIESAEELTGDSLLKVLLLFYRDCDYFTEEHVDQMFWFFSCGEEQSKKKFPRKIAGVNDKQPFDFQEDAGLIYAGFIQQYGIDLQTEEMHWWKFMLLLENLGEDTRLSKVIEYRTMDVSNKNLSKEEREFYRAMQKYYGLEQAPAMDDRTRQIEDALLNGGDVSELLRLKNERT